MDVVFPEAGRRQLGGFSLGGRIAMAAAAASSRPWAVRKLRLTGVARQRSVQGLGEVEHWRRLLRKQDLSGFAEAAIRASYAKVVPNQLPMRIENVCQSHQTDGLLALLEQAHDEDGEYSVASMARRLKQHSEGIVGQLVVGADDALLSPPAQVFALAEQLGWPAPTVIEKAGHAVPFEASRAWREGVLDFFNNTDY